MTLPPPQICAREDDIGFVPPLPAVHLRWPDARPRRWALPGGEALEGPPPARFGLSLRRQADDAYAVTLLWDSTYRQWYSLRRAELLASSLVPVLAALGTPLAEMLDRPAAHPTSAA
jgi:hypothetical protein